MPDLSLSRQDVLARQLSKPLDTNGLTPRTTLDFQQGKQKMSLSNSLFQFVIKGNVNKVRHVISRGANVNSKNDYGFGPLVAALHIEDDLKRRRMFQLLLDRGAPHKARDDKYHRTALHWACLLGQVEQVKSLLEDTAGDINLRDKDVDGFTALHHAVRVGSLQIVDTLVDFHSRFGISVDIADSLGLTPYIHARRLGYKDVATVLKDKGLASAGHGDNLFRSPREWSQIGKFERKKAIEIKAQDEVNVAKVLGRLHVSSTSGPRMAMPGIVMPSFHPSKVTGRRKPPHHMTVSLPSLDQDAIGDENEELEDRPVSTGRIAGNNKERVGDSFDVKPTLPKLAFSESQTVDSKSSIKSSDHGNQHFSTHDKNSTSSTQASTYSSAAIKSTHHYSSSSQAAEAQERGAPASIHGQTPRVPRTSFTVPVRTNSNMAALSLLEQTSFSKGKTPHQFHHSEFDKSKAAEYKHMLGNLNSIMEILSQQQTKSFRKSVEVKKPETPPKIKKKSKVSTMAIIFGHGNRRSGKRNKTRSPKGSSAKKRGDKSSEKSGNTSRKSSVSSSHPKGSKSDSKSLKTDGKTNKLPVPTIKIN